MENTLRALEMGFGVIVFCLGIYMMLLLSTHVDHEFKNFSNTIYENRMIRKD